MIPAEVIERDYGCGDPSKYVNPGETVLDLGSGTGKICFIASQVVGESGCVIGVDMTDDMLEIARKNAPLVAERIGYANVEFHKARIQDLALDLDVFEKVLAAHPVADANAFVAAEEAAEELRLKEPMVADETIDVVVSNCVLNLVSVAERKRLFAEVFRVLRVGGRAVISDIVCDEDVPREMQEDAELWSGCISGAFREGQFLQAFEEAGFYGVRILKLDKQPWQTVKGIEFRSMTIEATKGSDDTCLERHQAVIYKGRSRAWSTTTATRWSGASATPSATAPTATTRAALRRCLRIHRAARRGSDGEGEGVRLQHYQLPARRGDQGHRLRRDHRSEQLLRA